MAVVYWSARLAVNEEVRVRSPPVTPIASASRALTNGRQPVPKTGVVVMSPRGSIPPLSSREGPFGYQLGCRSFKAAKRGQHPHGLLMSRSSSPAEDAALSRHKRGFESRTRRRSPRQVDRGQDYESRLRRSNRLGGTTFGDVLEW